MYRDELADLLPELAKSRTPPVEVEVSVADDGASALSIATKFPPDLILLDSVMPGMTGGAVLLELVRRRVPTRVVVVTAHSKNHTDTIGFVKHGASEVLHKPLELDELVSSILRVVEVDPTLRERFADPALMIGIMEELRADSGREIAYLNGELRHVCEQRDAAWKELSFVKKEQYILHLMMRMLCVIAASLISFVLFSQGAITSGTQVIITICVVGGFLFAPITKLRSFVARLFNSEASAEFRK